MSVEPVVVVHYAEIGLKGKNRSYFERQLQKNIRCALRGLVEANAVRVGYGRLLVELPLNGPRLGITTGGSVSAYLRSDGLRQVIARLQKVFGIAYVGVGLRTDQTTDAFISAARELLSDQEFHSFKVHTRRSYKFFPKLSPEINAEVGQYVKDTFRKRVDLSNPDLTLFIEVAEKHAFVYVSKVRGPGGLPVGVSGRVVCLLSAGFDSPVAAYHLMKRGANVIFVHFHSYPYVSKNSIDQAFDLVKVLTEYQYQSVVYQVPFAEAQKVVVVNSPTALRVILYRRLMVRIAEAVARLESSQALVTGESLGQVASQTLSNIQVIDAAATLPILRPLIGMDKVDILTIARAIGTYELSSQPYDDCCSYLLPRSPETQAGLEQVLEGEKNIDVEGLVRQTVAASKRQIFKYEASPEGVRIGISDL